MVVSTETCPHVPGRSLPLAWAVREDLHDRKSSKNNALADVWHNKCFEQSSASNVSIHRNPVFCVFVWPLRAQLLQGTAQLKRIGICPPTTLITPC